MTKEIYSTTLENLGKKKIVDDDYKVFSYENETTVAPPMDEKYNLVRFDSNEGAWEVSKKVEIVEEEKHTLADALAEAEVSEEVLLKLKDYFPAWEPDVEYKAKKIVEFEGDLYRVVEPGHKSQSDWLPKDLPALYTKIVLKTEVDEDGNEELIEEWIQPVGAHDAYAKDTVVLYQDEKWKSTMNANVWAPPTGWEKVNI